MGGASRGVVWVCALCGLAVSAAWAAPPLVEDPLPAFYPELRTAPAPDWVRPGVRITYSTGADVVVITETGPAQRIDYTYDRATGRQIAFSDSITGPAGTIGTLLRLVRAQ